MKKAKILLISICALLVASLIFLAVAIVISLQPKEPTTVMGEFVPPLHEGSAKTGELALTDGDKALYGWHEQTPQGATFRAGFPIVMPIEGTKMAVWFQNPEANNVYLKLRITDTEKNIVAETGYLKPGEHIESVTLSREATAEETFTVLVMAYSIPTDTDTGFRSEGNFTIGPMRARETDVAVTPLADLSKHITEQELTEFSYQKYVPIGESGKTASFCATINATNTQLDLWFAAPAGQNASYLVEVLQLNGNLLAQSGFIDSDQFVKPLRVANPPADGTAVHVRVMAFDKETKAYLGESLFEATILNQTASEP